MLIVCTGTGTGVGKTWAGATLLSRLRASGRTVAARKPAQSFDPAEPGDTDADVLGHACGVTPEEVCAPHRWYPVAMAPPMAAEALGRPTFTVTDLVSELAWPEPEPDIRWVESVGGVRSPLADDGDTVTLCARLRPDLVVLVADAGLGTINSVVLSTVAIGDHRIVVLLNRYDDTADLHRRNRAWLAERAGLDVECTADALVDRLLPSPARDRRSAHFAKYRARP